MPFPIAFTAVGVVVLAGLAWLFVRTRQKDLIADYVAKRKPSSKLATAAQYVEGLEYFQVALSLTDTAVYYQNADIDASLELKDIEDVAYETEELATGRAVPHGCRALRLRSHGHMFEFLMSTADAQQWAAALPARQTEAPVARAV